MVTGLEGTERDRGGDVDNLVLKRWVIITAEAG
jgi:hypothetical protein